VLAAADDAAGSMGSLLAAVGKEAQLLVDMTESYTNRNYILKCITSSSFKERFDTAKDVSTDLLQALQLTMQAVQLKMQADANAAMAEAAKKSVKGVMTATAESMQINVEVDEKLDMIIEQQHQLLQQQKKQLEAQGETNVKMETLLEQLAILDPNLGDKEMNFSITGHMSQDVNMMNPMMQTLKSHSDGIQPWVTVQEEMDSMDVLSEAEWKWLGDFLGNALNHDFGEIQVHAVMGTMASAVNVLQPALKKATDEAAKPLKFEERGLKLKFNTLEGGLAASAKWTLKWPTTGPRVKRGEIDAPLPAIVSTALAGPAPMGGISTSCCTVL